MTKTILGLAIASALAVPLMAQADVSVTGKVSMSVDRQDNGTSATGVHTKQTSMVDNQSRIGIRGSESLGDGLSVQFVYGAGLNATSSSAGPTTRNAAVGFKGGLGTVFLGNQNGEMGTVSPVYNQKDLVAYNVNYNDSGLSLIGQRTSINSVGVKTALAGVDIDASYGLKGKDANGNMVTNNVRDMQVAATYMTGPLTVGAAAQNVSSDTMMNVGDLKSHAQLVGAYDLGMAKVSMLYGTDKVATATGFDDLNSYLVSGKVPLTAMTYGVVSAGRGDTVANGKQTSYMLGVGLDMSKNTSVYSGLSRKVDDVGSTNLASAGLSVKF